MYGRFEKHPDICWYAVVGGGHRSPYEKIPNTPDIENFRFKGIIDNRKGNSGPPERLILKGENDTLISIKGNSFKLKKIEEYLSNPNLLGKSWSELEELINSLDL
jgi:hypothetical protein